MFSVNPTIRALRLPATAMLLLILSGVALSDEARDPPGRVARVNLTLGRSSLEPARTSTWIDDVLNRPLTNGDRLWVERDARLEMHVGSAAIRLGSETGVELLNVDDRTIQLKLTAGTLQLQVRALSAEQTVEVSTPQAAVSVLRPGVYRIDVGDSGDQLRVAVTEGQVAIADRSTATTLETGQLGEYGGASIAEGQITSLRPADAFDEWTMQRDRREDRALSPRYVSREMSGYEDLDDYGSWRVVDQYGPVWAPRVGSDWAPYQNGHWVWISPWGWTWIDAAPWGFAPFHYGRWVHVRGAWCWAPGPRMAAPVYAPALVGWVGGSGWSVQVGVGRGPVGWFPLGWNEVYVPAHHASGDYIRQVNVTNIYVTNEYVNNYVINHPAGGTDAGRRSTGDRGLRAPQHEQGRSNFGVPGAVTATTQEAFTTAQPVAQHRTPIIGERLTPQVMGSAPPAAAPTARSIGRPSAQTPGAAPEVWTRPVFADRAPPPLRPATPMQDRPPAGRNAIPGQRRDAEGTDDRGTRAVRPWTGRPDMPRSDRPTLPPQDTRAVPADRPSRPTEAQNRELPSAPTPQDRPHRTEMPNVPEYRPAPAPEDRPRRTQGPDGRESRPAPQERPQRIEVPSTPEYRPTPAPEDRPRRMQAPDIRESRPAPAPPERPQRMEAPSAPEYRPTPSPEERPRRFEPPSAPVYRPAPAPEERPHRAEAPEARELRAPPPPQAPPQAPARRVEPASPHDAPPPADRPNRPSRPDRDH